MRLSVIVPVWNDPVALRTILAMLSALRGIDEVIVGDASTSDECAHIAIDAGAIVVRCEKPGRGQQMNAAAAVATGDILLFHHADTGLQQPHVDSLRTAMKNEDIVGGAYHRKFDARHPRFMWLERWNRMLLEAGGTVFGDQSIFVRRAVFQRMGGYANHRLMEDVEFSSRLVREGRRVLLDPPIATGARHHVKGGSWRTSVRNGMMILLFHAGASPDFLHAWYYRRWS